jgi:hypothetical protein
MAVDPRFVGCACKCICHIHNGKPLRCTNQARAGTLYCYNCTYYKGCKRE